MRLHSDEGIGTTVVLTLPVVAAVDSPPADALPPEPQTDAPQPAADTLSAPDDAPVVLVVEDDADTSDFIYQGHLEVGAVEPEPLHVEAGQTVQLLRKQLAVPLSQLAHAVVREAIGGALLRREVRGHDHGNLIHLERERGLVARVAGNDGAVRVHDDGLTPAELSDARGHGLHGAVVAARVVLVGMHVADGDVPDAKLARDGDHPLEKLALCVDYDYAAGRQAS